ncbi:YHYH domain-containing protein [Hyalangium sp.]|uniref:YHYH domain-containing protein n=1 Tax=Hyalangium sp. TaxID=2028555 RepID=UPI0032C234AB
MVRALAFGSLLLPLVSLAHPGGLDSSGCHNDKKHGGYHCHGAPASTASPPPMRSSVTWEARRMDPPDAGVPDAGTRRAPPRRLDLPSLPAATAPKADPVRTPGSADDGRDLLCFMACIVAIPLGLYVLLRRRRAPGTPAPETREDESGPRRRREPPRAGERGLTATRKGKCTECGRWFGEGAPIFWNASTRRARHVRCEEA